MNTILKYKDNSNTVAGMKLSFSSGDHTPELFKKRNRIKANEIKNTILIYSTNIKINGINHGTGSQGDIPK
jgi:hypothetical protein